MNYNFILFSANRCEKTVKRFNSCAKTAFLQIINQTAVGSQFIDQKFNGDEFYSSDEYYYYN